MKRSSSMLADVGEVMLHKLKAVSTTWTIRRKYREWKLNRNKLSLDPTQTEVVRKFVEASDALGPPGSDAVNAY